jgi:preprotein translocase subunit SecF
MENIVRHRYWWFALSLLIIIPGLISLGVYGLRLGIDFSGGSLWDVRFLERTAEQLNTEEIAQIFDAQGLENSQVQLSSSVVNGQTYPAAIVRTKDATPDLQEQVLAALSEKFGAVERAEVQSVGETVSAESTRSAIIAVIAACLVILFYLTLAFRKAPNPFRYGVCAVLAMAHDVILVIGVASILGQITGLEVDALFLTALLTVISFSVHDTIVVFDRIRENVQHQRASEKFEDIVNRSIVQTMPRSINTQLTSLFTLVALLMFGGESIQNFVLILLIGLLSGTISSIFNAAQLLVVWENREWRYWFGRNKNEEVAA